MHSAAIHEKNQPHLFMSRVCRQIGVEQVAPVTALRCIRFDKHQGRRAPWGLEWNKGIGRLPFSPMTTFCIPLRAALLASLAMAAAAAMAQGVAPSDAAASRACTQAQEKSLRLAQLHVRAAEDAYQLAEDRVQKATVALQDAWQQLRQMDERENGAPPPAHPLSTQWDEVARRRAGMDAAVEARAQAAAEGERARSALEKAVARDKSCTG